MPENKQFGQKIKVRILNNFKSQPLSDWQANSEDKEVREFIDEPPQGEERPNDFMNKKPKRLKKIFFFLLAILIIILGATIASFWFFGQKQSGNLSVDLKIQAPIEVSSGNEIEYLVEIKNNESVALTKMDLLLQYPLGFEFNQATLQPVNETKNSFALPDLEAGKKYQLSVKGRLIGEVGESKVIAATLNYQPINFSSNFKLEKSTASFIKDSILGLSAGSPEQIIGTQSFDLTIKYKNNTLSPLTNVRLSLDLPEGLVIEKSTSTPITGEWYWQKEALAPGAEETVLVKAHYEQNLNNDNKLAINLGQVGVDKQFKIITDKRLSLNVLEPAVDLKLTLNGQENMPAVNWGEELNYKIKIKNNSKDFSIPKALLFISLNNDLIDPTTLKEDNGAVWTDSGLVWGEQSKIWSDFLQNLGAGQEKEISFTVKTVDQIGSLDPTKLKIEAQALIHSVELGDNFLLASNKITTNVGDAVQFSAKAYYYLTKTIQVGTGPVPPAVGQATSYKVYWYLTASNNDLKNITVKAILPPAIVWKNSFQETAGDLTYDQSTRQISWKITKLTANESAQANFYLNLTPDSSQVGQIITLLNPSTLTAAQNNKAVNQSADSLDSNLLYDPVKSGLGAVVE
jgi:hypothetical protein